MAISYQTQSLDTTFQAEVYLFDLWRSWSLLKKSLHLNCSTYDLRSTAWYLAQLQSDSLEKTQRTNYFLNKIGDSALFPLISVPSRYFTMLGVIEEALVVTNILESLGIPYFIGGSVASGIWGELRYTQDLDLVSDIHLDHIEDLITAFSPQFYISNSAVREAIENKQSFNLIDNYTGWKIDIFILALDSFHQNQFQRRQIVTVDEQQNTLWFSSAEDTILQKILWYHFSQKQSEQQWRDILGILKLQKDRLDVIYLRDWAHFLGISSDLETALAESGY